MTREARSLPCGRKFSPNRRLSADEEPRRGPRAVLTATRSQSFHLKTIGGVAE